VAGPRRQQADQHGREENFRLKGSRTAKPESSGSGISESDVCKCWYRAGYSHGSREWTPGQRHLIFHEGLATYNIVIEPLLVNQF
jgi:hypothetical protein